MTRLDDFHPLDVGCLRREIAMLNVDQARSYPLAQDFLDSSDHGGASLTPASDENALVTG
jgi:hypothetical protein